MRACFSWWVLLGAFFLSACTAQTNSPSVDETSTLQAGSLVRTTWILEALPQSSHLDPGVLSKPPELSFGDDIGIVRGFGGCNRFFGNAVVHDNNFLRFSRMGASKVACPHLAFEKVYLNSLPRVRRGEIKNSQLFLYDQANGLLMSFRKVD